MNGLSGLRLGTRTGIAATGTMAVLAVGVVAAPGAANASTVAPMAGKCGKDAVVYQDYPDGHTVVTCFPKTKYDFEMPHVDFFCAKTKSSGYATQFTFKELLWPVFVNSGECDSVSEKYTLISVVV